MSQWIKWWGRVGRKFCRWEMYGPLSVRHLLLIALVLRLCRLMHVRNNVFTCSHALCMDREEATVLWRTLCPQVLCFLCVCAWVLVCVWADLNSATVWNPLATRPLCCYRKAMEHWTTNNFPVAFTQTTEGFDCLTEAHRAQCHQEEVTRYICLRSMHCKCSEIFSCPPYFSSHS